MKMRTAKKLRVRCHCDHKDDGRDFPSETFTDKTEDDDNHDVGQQQAVALLALLV
jgi:hypothetical protein